MAKHIFKTEDIFDTVEVGEHEFTINMSDEKIREFRGLIYKYGSDFNELTETNIDNLSEDEAAALEAKAMELLRNVIDGILEKGAFTKIYETLGRSSLVVGGFTEYLFGLIDEKYSDTKAKKASKYTAQPAARSASK